MKVKVKINPEKIKLALISGGYASIAEFGKKAKISPSTITKAFKTSGLTYSVAFKLKECLGVYAEDFIITD